LYSDQTPNLRTIFAGYPYLDSQNRKVMFTEKVDYIYGILRKPR
jgi:hypothetical protein